MCKHVCRGIGHFFIERAARGSAIGDVRKVMWIDIGEAHLYAPMSRNNLIEDGYSCMLSFAL